MTTELTTTNAAPPALTEHMVNALRGMSRDDIEIPNVTVPSSGSTVWQIPGEVEGKPRNAEYLEGVVVNHYSVDALYLQTRQDNPDAGVAAMWIAGELVSASDAALKAGVDPTLPLSEQPLNQYGSASLVGRDGAGKAIQNRWAIYLIEHGEILPMRISVPAMSRKAWSNYQLKVYSMRPMTSVVVKLGLSRRENKQGQPYSQMTCETVGVLEGEAAAHYANLAELVRPLTVFEPHADHVPAAAAPATGNAAVDSVAGAFDGTADGDLPF